MSSPQIVNEPVGSAGPNGGYLGGAGAAAGGPDFSPAGRLRAGLVLLLLGAVLLMNGLGSYALLDRDESRYAQIPREMIERGDWLRPTLFGEIYQDKPPLQYWQVAICFEVFGRNEFAARLPTALAALGLLAGIYWLTACVAGVRAGFVTGCVLLTMLLFFGLGRYLVLDGVLSAYVVLAALLAFANLPRPPGMPPVPSGRHDAAGNALVGTRSVVRAVILWVLLGLAVLVKGPVALVLFGSPFIALRIWQHGLRWLWTPPLWWRLMVDVHLPIGLPILVLVAAPWFVAMEQAKPGFCEEFFMKQNLQRFATNAFPRSQPFYFFVLIAIAGLFPWTPFIPDALTRFFRGGGWRSLPIARPLVAFGLCLGLFPILFFSISRSKLIPYIAPCFPGFALVLGLYFEELLADVQAKPPRMAAQVLGSAAVAIGAAPWAYLWMVSTGKLQPHVVLNLLPLTLFSLPMVALGLYLTLAGHLISTRAMLASICATMFAFFGFAMTDGLTSRVGEGFSHAALIREIDRDEATDPRPLWVYRENDEHASFYFYSADWRRLQVASRDKTALRMQLQKAGSVRLVLHQHDDAKVRALIGDAFRVTVVRETGNSLEFGVQYTGPAAP